MASSLGFSTKLCDLEPYILGKKYFGEAKNQPRITQEIFDKFVRCLEEDPIAKEFFTVFDAAADFYNTAVDFKYHIPKEMRTEVFYAAKNGYAYVQVPSFCVFMLTKAWEKCSGIPNLLFKVLPAVCIKEFCKKDYLLGGLTLRDVICNVCTPKYTPLSMYHSKNKLKEFTEVYIQSTDMVAAVPNSIGDCLSEDSIASIKLGTYGLEINGVLIRTMCGYVGATNSNYDLRRLL